MKNILLVIIVALLAAAGISSCTDYQNPVEPVFQPNPGDTVKFAEEIIPIFNARCNSAGCHAPGKIPPDLTPANAHFELITFGYVDTDSAELSILYIKVHSGSMQKFTEPNDAPKILEWIRQGALDN